MKFYGTVFNFLLFGWSCLSLRYHHSSIRHNFSGLISRQKQPKADQSLRFHAKLSDSTVVCLDSFVECFELQNWGLFEHSVLTLGSAPLFAVITGETGSGKSLLVSALQYLYSNSGTPQSRRNIKGKGDSFISNAQSSAKSKVTLRRGLEEYTKSYDGKNRKTLCELNGMKITMKAVVGNLRDDVRFWSSESLSLLDPGPEGFVNYVDKNLCDRGNSLLFEAESAYNVWIESHGKLSQLRHLQIRKEGNDELESFSEHVESVSLFELKVQKVLSEAFYILNEINDALYDGATSKEEEGGRQDHDSSLTPNSKTSSTSTKSASASVTVSIDELLKKIQVTLSDSFLSSSSSSSTSSLNHHDGGVAVHEYNESTGLSSDSEYSSDDSTSVSSSAAMIAWDLALLTEDFLSNLSTTLDGTLFSIDNIMSSANSNSNSNTGNSNKVRNKDNLNGKESDFNTMINTVGEQENKIIMLQTEFEKLNLKNTNFNEKMENLHKYFQAIEFNMVRLKKEILDMRNSLPILKINDVIGKFQALVTESEKLCKRHGVRTYSDLQIESRKWQNDLILMENLIYTLPASEKQELKLRQKYTEIALDLTEMRLLGAHQFINRVNDMLPELEMGDKSIGVNFLMLAGRDRTGSGTGTGVISSSNGMASNRGEGAEDDRDLELAFCNWKKSFFHITDTKIRKADSHSKTSPAEVKNDNNSGEDIEDKQGGNIAGGVRGSNVEGISVGDKVIDKDKEKHDALKKELVSKLAESLSPIAGATGRGWDDIALSVRTCRKKVTRKGDGELEERVEAVHDTIPVPIPIPMITPMSSLIHLDLNSLKVLSFDDDPAAAVDRESSSEVSVLSSGESTRLALAMETCTHTAPVIITHTAIEPPLPLEGSGSLSDSPGQGQGGEDAGNGQSNIKEDQEMGFIMKDGVKRNGGEREREREEAKVKGRSFEGLLILDEIDAHIGGEAAVAVARLLKGQGRWRQVIAITHNPLLASLADRHYVVSKLTSSDGDAAGSSPIAAAAARTIGSDSDEGSHQRGLTVGVGLRSRSVLTEVQGVERELEISRMATGGGVHSAAGIALARALLSQGQR